MGEENDDWYNMTVTNSNSSHDPSTQPPHIRLKIKYKHDVILPLKDYADLQKVTISVLITNIDTGTLIHLHAAKLSQKKISIYKMLH